MDTISSEFALFRAALEGLPEGFMLFRPLRDGSGTIVDFEWIFANRIAAGLVRCDPDDLRGKRMSEVVPGCRDNGSFERYVGVVETGAPAEVPWCCDHAARGSWFVHRCFKVCDGMAVLCSERGLASPHGDPWRLVQQLFAQAPFGIAVLEGPAHRFAIANPYFEQMVGRRDLVGKFTREVFPEVGSDSHVRRMLDGVWTSGKAFTAAEFPVRFDVDADGEVEDRYFQFTCSPMREGDETVAIQAVAVDVTTQVRSRRHAEEMAEELEENERRFRATFENAAVGIAHIAPSGLWLRFNERIRSILGYSREELSQITFQEVTHPDDVDRDVELAQSLLRGDIASYQLEQRYVRKSGEAVWVNVTVSLVRGENGTPLFFVSIVKDIAERKAAEAALREADRQKDEFLAMLSHELRNPLAVVRSASELLETIATTDTVMPRIQKVLERQTSHMARLLDDLLDLARITSGKLTLDPDVVDLREVVRGVVSDLEPGMRQQLCFTVDLSPSPLWVLGDRTRLAQVTHNLLSNALKYTPANGSVTLRLGTAGDGAVITVTDTGIGLDPEFRPHLFKPFQQAPQDIARSAGGLGLGLALSKTIVELHQGTIEARSAGRDRGSEFEVWLPLAHQEPITLGRGPVQRRRTLRFLVVEDNEDGAELLATLLAARGHAVEIAVRGHEALQVLQTWSPDVVICDIGLPDIDGYEVARRLRADPRFANTKLVALSGYGQDDDRRRSAEAGFDMHFTKPAEVDTILRAIADPLPATASTAPPAP